MNQLLFVRRAPSTPLIGIIVSGLQSRESSILELMQRLKERDITLVDIVTTQDELLKFLEAHHLHEVDFGAQLVDAFNAGGESGIVELLDNLPIPTSPGKLLQKVLEEQMKPVTLAATLNLHREVLYLDNSRRTPKIPRKWRKIFGGEPHQHFEANRARRTPHNGFH